MPYSAHYCFQLNQLLRIKSCNLAPPEYLDQRAVLYSSPGWQKLRERVRRRIWTQTKILSPNIHHFFAVLRSVAIYAYFEAFIFAILVIRATFLLQISKYASDERNEGNFCVHRKPANLCHPGKYPTLG